MKIKTEEIIKALRCSASPMSERCDCKACPYRTEEEVSERFKLFAEFERDGVLYCEGCDCDKIAMDAADRLEALIDA